jgi:hypothetical protein
MLTWDPRHCSLPRWTPCHPYPLGWTSTLEGNKHHKIERCDRRAVLLKARRLYIAANWWRGHSECACSYKQQQKYTHLDLSAVDYFGDCGLLPPSKMTHDDNHKEDNVLYCLNMSLLASVLEGEHYTTLWNPAFNEEPNRVQKENTLTDWDIVWNISAECRRVTIMIWIMGMLMNVLHKIIRILGLQVMYRRIDIARTDFPSVDGRSSEIASILWVDSHQQILAVKQRLC